MFAFRPKKSALADGKEQMQFDFKIENKTLTQMNEADPVICDNSDYSVHFTFDGEWDGVTKTVRFTNGKNYVDVILPNNNTVLIPREIISPPAVYLGVYAPAVRTTAPAKIPCRSSILTPSGTPAVPVEDVYLQLLSRYDELKDEQSELLEGVALANQNEAQRVIAEKKREQAELERQELTKELSEHSTRYANAYRVVSENDGSVTVVSIDNLPVGSQPLSFTLFGKTQETVPAEGKSPDSPSSFSFQKPARILVGSKNITPEKDIFLYSLADDTRDEYDVLKGEIIHRVGVAKFKKIFNSLFLVDEISGDCGFLPFDVIPVDVSGKNTNFFMDTSEMYPRGKRGINALCTHFVRHETLDECESGCYYDDEIMYFAYGEEKLDDETAKAQFNALIEREMEKGTDITIYYEYAEPYVEKIAPKEIIFTTTQATVNTRRVPFEMTYNADMVLVIDSLKSDIEELKTQLTLLAEGGEA